MSKFWIFGDSFADENYVFAEHKNWYDYIDNRENFAIQGIGSTFLLKSLIEKIESINNEELKTINLIVFLPDPYRLDLIYLPDSGYAANAKNFFDTFEKGADIKSVYEFKNIKDIDFYNKNLNRIVDNYLNFYEIGLNELLPIFVLTTLLSITRFFKRTLIWPSNYMYSQNKFTEHIGIDFKLIYDNYQYENVYLIDTPLIELSFSETDVNSHYFLDKRNNHLNEEQHRQVFNVVNEWFTNEKKLIVMKSNLNTL